MELTYATDEHAGVTLVEFELHNPTRTPREVTVRCELDGPVWPPRRGGYPEEGWDQTGFVGPIGAGDRRALGFACPAPATDPPVSVVTTDPIEEATPERTPADLVRTLGDPRPPPVDTDPRDDTVAATEDSATDTEPTEGAVAPAEADGSVPPAIAAWFDLIAARLDADDPVDADRVCAVADRATELHRRCRR